jgi:hypothetical protein
MNDQELRELLQDIKFDEEVHGEKNKRQNSANRKLTLREAIYMPAGAEEEFEFEEFKKKQLNKTWKNKKKLTENIKQIYKRDNYCLLK